MAETPDKKESGEGVHTGATGWEALIPLDFSRLSSLTNEPVPQHLKRWWFSLGGTPAYLFFIQITTGLLLTFYYRPGGEAAYESVARLTYDIPFGWFIRSIHKWSANLMIITMVLHLLRVFFTRAYRHPRELTWVFGVALLGLTLALGFTGYSLLYEQLSYWGATVATNLTESVPLIGPAMAAFIRGGPVVDEGTMTRLFLLHVLILPAVLVGVLGIHLTLVRIHGVTEYDFEDDSERPSRGFGFIPKLLAGLAGLGAIFCLGAAIVGRPPFEFVGYDFLATSSRVIFFAAFLLLAAGSVALFQQRLSGLFIFLTAAILGLAKVGRDLMVGEAGDATIWMVTFFVLLGGIILALLGHRSFKEKAKKDEAATFNFFPDHITTEIMIGTGLLFLLVVLSLVFPATLGDVADPQNTPDHIKPEWYFYFQFRLLKVLPGLPALGLTALDVSVLLTGVFLAIVVFWPWLDRLLEWIAPKKNLPLYVGIFGFLWFLAFTIWEAMVH